MYRPHCCCRAEKMHKCFLLNASSPRQRSRSRWGLEVVLCTEQQAGHRDRPTPDLLVSQPDDLGFGVALGSAGEEDGVPRGDICVLGLGRDPGSFCTNKETENFLVLSRQGSKDPSDTPYVMSKSQVSSCMRLQISPQSGRQFHPWETT